MQVGSFTLYVLVNTRERGLVQLAGVHPTASSQPTPFRKRSEASAGAAETGVLLPSGVENEDGVPERVSARP
jgi:hypothetical protein